MNRGRGTKKRGHQDRRFFAALVISLVIHVVLLAVLHDGWIGERSVLHYRRVSPTLLVTTAEFSPGVPVRETDNSANPEVKEISQGEASVVTPLSENTAPLPKSPPENIPKPEVLKPDGPKPKDESGELLAATGTNSPALPTGEQDISQGSRDTEPQTSPVGNSSETGSGVIEPIKGEQFSSSAYYDKKNLRDELEHQLLLYIEAHKRYPSTARRRGLNGEVKLLLTMTGGRRVDLGSTVLIQSAGSRLLDREAVRLVESFFPYEPGGGIGREIEQELSTTVKISYRLR